MSLSCEEHVSERYQAMFYKNSNSIGIRRKFDAKKTQVISFGGKKCKMTEVLLRKLADETLIKVDEGISERRAKTWARNEVVSRSADL
jgi:hypothetical protein